MLNFDEFRAFYKGLCTRRDIGNIMRVYGKSPTGPPRDNTFDTFDDVSLSAADLCRFMREEQRHEGIEEEWCADLIQQFEPASQGVPLKYNAATRILHWCC